MSVELFKFWSKPLEIRSKPLVLCLHELWGQGFLSIM